MDKKRMPNEMPGHRTEFGVVAVILANRLAEQLKIRYEQGHLAPQARLYWQTDDCVPFGD